jgi:hypothetical protein
LNYKCSGTCIPPLFSITRDISEGIPEFECLGMIIPGLKNNLQIVGFTTFILGLISLLSFFISIPLFTPLKKEKDRKRTKFEL